LISNIDKHLGSLKNDPGSDYYILLNRWLDLPAPTAKPKSLRWQVFIAVILIAGMAFLVFRLSGKLYRRGRELRFRSGILESANKMLEELLEEKRIAEITLKESEEAFKSLFRHSADAFALIKDDYFFDFNNAALNFFGYNSRDELLGKSPWELSPELQADGTKSQMKAREVMNYTLQNGNHRFEWLHLKKDGSIITAEIMLTMIYFKGDKILHVSLRDISGRKKMEENLRLSEERYRLLIENQNDLIVKFDPDGSFYLLVLLTAGCLGKNRKNY